MLKSRPSDADELQYLKRREFELKTDLDFINNTTKDQTLVRMRAYMDKLEESLVARLVEAKDPVSIHTAQGSIKLLRSLRGLPQKMQNELAFVEKRIKLVETKLGKTNG